MHQLARPFPRLPEEDLPFEGLLVQEVLEEVLVVHPEEAHLVEDLPEEVQEEHPEEVHFVEVRPEEVLVLPEEVRPEEALVEDMVLVQGPRLLEVQGQ